MSIKQRSGNDCAVASVAVFLGISYDTSLHAAQEDGFVLGANDGADVGDILTCLEYDFDWILGLTDKRPCVVSIASINLPGRHHAITLSKNEVLDPSPNSTAEMNHIETTAYISYFNARKALVNPYVKAVQPSP